MIYKIKLKFLHWLHMRAGALEEFAIWANTKTGMWLDNYCEHRGTILEFDGERYCSVCWKVFEKGE